MKFLPDRRQLWMLWIMTLVMYLGDWLYPVSNGLTRPLGVALLAVVWGGLVALLWRRRAARYGLLCVTLFCAVFLVLPGRKGHYDTAAMRGDVAAALLRYEGARYYWGGESPMGIDCSGFVRRGMIDGMFLRGARTLDPGLVRWAIRLWWHDCSAKDLGEGHGMTTHLFDTPSLNALDQSRLLPGDIAVTEPGTHVMAYLGNSRWIEADPSGHVITVNVPSRDNEWFRTPMKIMRWDILR